MGAPRRARGMRLASLVALTLVACSHAGAPEVPPRPAVSKKKPQMEVAPSKPERPLDVVGRSPSYADEPVVECDDPDDEVVRPAPLRASDDEPDDRGWIDFGEPIHRSGCVPPSELRFRLHETKGAMFECFAEASADAFSMRLRMRVARTSGGRLRITTEVLLPRWSTHVDRPDPSSDVDQGRLQACLDEVMSSIEHLGDDSRLPAVFDLPVVRGVPGEGGVPLEDALPPAQP